MRSLKQIWAATVGEDVARHFPFATHRLVLGILLAAAFVGQSVVAVDALRPNQLVQGQLLANESDANAVVIVQRESFNLAIALANWGHGATTAREVQVARALLGQRLGVVTQSRTLTAANVGKDYLAALTALDEVLRRLPDVPQGSEAETLAAADPTLQGFLTETRALNEAFQRLGRMQVTLLLESDRQRQWLQVGLQATIMLLLGLLSLSVVIAVGRGYGSVSRTLAAERRQVELARRELDVVRELDVGIKPLMSAIDAGTPAAVVRERLRGMLGALSIGQELELRWSVPDGADGQVTPATDLRADVQPEAGWLEIVASRAQSVVDALRRRESAARAAEIVRLHDPLTGLVNRLGFVRELTHLLGATPDRPVVLCFLDIDRFSEVNGALGFAGADRVLVEVAGRLQSALTGGPRRIVARVAGDEFAVAVQIAEEEARVVVDGLRAAGTYLSHAGGMEAAISVSVGEAVGVGADLDAAELMRRGAVAMLLAKESSDRRGHVRFDPVAHQHLSSTLIDELAVRDGLRDGEFRMHYQPIVDMATGRPVGLEALSRWERPGVGLVPPGEFLPIIERGGFMVEFGLECIVEVITTWKRSLRAALVGVSGPTASVSVNVDAVQLADAGFESFVLSALERADMEPRELVLELTEHAAIDRGHAPMLDRLRAAGVRIAVDDFGSGFSSLGQSALLPVDSLKLDRSFVASLLASGNDPALFVDLARMARTLGMTLIAEGIETRAVADLLLGSGIHLGQGFLYSTALTEADAVRWIRQHGARLPDDLTAPVGVEG